MVSDLCSVFLLVLFGGWEVVVLFFLVFFFPPRGFGSPHPLPVLSC